MGDRKQELIQEEDAHWAELLATVDSVPEDRLLRPGVTELWTGKDLLAHLACWMAEAAKELERIRLGTYESRPLDLDAMNARFYEAMKDRPLREVRAELGAARTRMYQEWAAQPEVTDASEEWFVESGPAHVAEHLPELRAFLAGDGT